MAITKDLAPRRAGNPQQEKEKVQYHCRIQLLV